MRVNRFIYSILVAASITACTTATGPIKTYDAGVDTNSISRIYLPPEIELLEVDGKEYATPYIEQGYNQVLIAPGGHQIAVKYVKYWGDGSSGSIVKSEPVVLGLDVAPKAKYYLKYKKPKDQWEALTLIKAFVPWLEDASGKKLQVINNTKGGGLLTSTSKSLTSRQSSSGKTPLENLKFWWKNASYQEKKAFEGWLGTN